MLKVKYWLYNLILMWHVRWRGSVCLFPTCLQSTVCPSWGLLSHCSWLKTYLQLPRYQAYIDHEKWLNGGLLFLLTANNCVITELTEPWRVLSCFSLHIPTILFSGPGNNTSHQAKQSEAKNRTRAITTTKSFQLWGWPFNTRIVVGNSKITKMLWTIATLLPFMQLTLVLS